MNPIDYRQDTLDRSNPEGGIGLKGVTVFVTNSNVRVIRSV